MDHPFWATLAKVSSEPPPKMIGNLHPLVRGLVALAF